MKTSYPPAHKPMLVFDGDCGFCRYWLVKWKKLSRDHYDYQPFQKVANQFKDIPFEDFQKAVHLIFSDGTVIKGAAVAYYPYFQFGNAGFLYKWYQRNRSFQQISDLAYQWVARNRNFCFKVSKALFGKDPYKNAFLILAYRLVAAVVIILIALYLTSIWQP